MNKKRWRTETVLHTVEMLPFVESAKVGDRGSGYDTESVIVKVKGADPDSPYLWVRGFVTDGVQIESNNVDVEMVEVTTGYSDGAMPSDPELCIAWGYVTATLIRLGFMVVASMDPYF